MDVDNMRDQPRGDGTRITAVRVPSLLDDALFDVPRCGHVGAVTPDGGGLRSTDTLVLDPSVSILS